MKAVLLVNVLATLTMFGAIWIVQVVHYPLFGLVGESTWTSYEAQHQSRITLVVGPAMVAELATAVWLAVRPFPGVPAWVFVLGAALVGLVWASTALLQVPLHASLSAAFSGEAHTRLVATNWIRTALWSARSGLMLWVVWRLLDPPAA